MNLGLAMRWDVLQDKLDEGRVRQRGVATWNTRRLPTRLTPGWTNRLYVACRGTWRGSFPLSGDVYWNPRDTAAPYALIFDPRGWKPTAPVPCSPFRGWRHRGLTRRATAGGDFSSRRAQPGGKAYSKDSLKESAIKRWLSFPHRPLLLRPHWP
jgi:hypothetical protein